MKSNLFVGGVTTTTTSTITSTTATPTRTATLHNQQLSNKDMATFPSSAWSAAPTANSTAAAGGGGTALLNFVGGSNSNVDAAKNDTSASGNARNDIEAWTKGGREFANPREIYSRSLFRICLKFTTSEDEDEGKPEPATAYWTLYGRPTTIGNGGPNSHSPDTICRRMDDSMTGPAAGILSRITDQDGDQATQYALRSGMTSGWQIRGDRGDAAVRVGKAKVFTSGKNGPDGGPTREVQILTLDADRWVLCKGASFAAGNSVFNVEDCVESKQRITIHSSKGPMRGKLIEVQASKCPYVFGRAHQADLCIMDRELSRRHGAILYLPNRNSVKGKNGSGVFVLVDLESTVRLSLHITS